MIPVFRCPVAAHQRGGPLHHSPECGPENRSLVRAFHCLDTFGCVVNVWLIPDIFWFLYRRPDSSLFDPFTISRSFCSTLQRLYCLLTSVLFLTIRALCASHSTLKLASITTGQKPINALPFVLPHLPFLFQRELILRPVDLHRVVSCTNVDRLLNSGNSAMKRYRFHRKDFSIHKDAAVNGKHFLSPLFC